MAMIRSSRRLLSSALPQGLKASPTVQRLIRESNLESWPGLGATVSGPKGTLTAADVASAARPSAERRERTRRAGRWGG